ncbi:ankyrin repeat and zinc finger domain-containing protein 1, partial [Tremellales sp. Uapishka_1]
MNGGSSVLNRPLSVYQFPLEILVNLTVRSIQQPAATASEESAQPKSDPVVDNASSIRCQTCPAAAFDSVEEQRVHFKSDWHRYNAKAKLVGRSVGIEEWENMVEGVSSISGSASSSSSSGSELDDKVTKLLSKQTISKVKSPSQDSDEEAELEDRRRRAQLRTAVIWFTPRAPIESLGIPKDTQFGIHRALFPPFANAADFLEELRRMQLGDQVEEEEDERRITLLMVAGGHFAGMVVGLRPRGRNQKQDLKGAGDVRVIKSKTFHRYTTRKKQGGSQALNDNAKSKAVSAGAMLRRYGESALQEEIRQLMIDWKEDLDLSERIFVRASTHGKKSFWGYEGAMIEKGDPRIRVFPFPTRRPTVTELLRCWHELVRVKVSHLSEESLQALDQAYITSLQPKKQIIKPVPAPTPAPVAAAPKISPEEEARLDRQKRLHEMIKKGKLEPIKTFWEKYSAEFDSTLLGVVSASGQEDVLRYFLEEVKLDPTTDVDENENGRTTKPYDLASTKGMRNVFRRLAFDQPALWDWKVAHVPSGLSEESELNQEKKKMERRKGLKEKLKEREKARSVVEEEEIVPAVVPTVERGPSVGPQKLGGRPGGEGGLGGMSREMREMIERERRARAAEARLRG